MKKEYLECGRILHSHGVRGAMKVESYCDSLAVLAGLKTVYLQSKSGALTPAEVTSAKAADRYVLMHLEGIADPESVRLLQGKTLYAKRSDLPCPEGSYFLADLIGLPVIDADSGRNYGSLRQIDDTRPTTLYVIATEDGEVLLPAVPEFIKEIDTDRGIFIRPIPGFFHEI